MANKGSNIIQLMDGLYEYELPPEPRDEKSILFYDMPKKDQFWRQPVIHNVKRMTERERIEYIEIHRRRWDEGVWFFNNGEPTYITGIHYDFLTFCDFEDFGGKPNYLDQQRLDFYFRDLVRKDPRCYGSVILKCRRCGMTAEEMCQAIYTLLEDEKCKIGLQSNELQKKCLPELMHPIINMYVKRPKWMREDFYTPNGKKPRNTLELTSNKMDGESDSTESDDRLGGNVIPYPTTTGAMDGSKKRYVIMDEVWKWKEASPLDTLGINKKCVVQYGIKGKISMLSTMGDSDSYHVAIKEGCQIWGQSNPRVRDPNGRTTSGLYKWFVSGIHSADIPEEWRDVKYGKVNKEKAEEYIWNEVNKHDKNSKDYVFELRRLPPEEKYALMAANDKSYWSVIRIDSRLQELNELPKDKKPYVRGSLVEDSHGRVHFEANETGFWLVALHPYFSVERGIDTRNRFRVHNGIYFPPVNPEGCVGYDPFRYKTSNTTSNNLSKACIIVYKKYDYFNSGESNQYCALMLHRPNDPNDAHKEFFKACKYWGYPGMAERQVETTETVAEDMRMIPFLLKSKDKVWGIWSTPKTTENGVQKLATKFSPPKTEVDTDQIAIYPFEEGLIDYKNFDMTDTLSSHVTMATIMCEEGLEQVQYTNETDNSVNTVRNVIQEIIVPRNR
jgi:hypothetical protein